MTLRFLISKITRFQIWFPQIYTYDYFSHTSPYFFMHRSKCNTMPIKHKVNFYFIIGAVRNGLSVINSTLGNILNRVGSASDKIRDLLEEFRKVMMKGIPELGIPILEPLTIDRIDLNVSHEIAK